MKRFCSLLLASIGVVFLAACGGETDAHQTENPTTGAQLRVEKLGMNLAFPDGWAEVPPTEWPRAERDAGALAAAFFGAGELGGTFRVERFAAQDGDSIASLFARNRAAVEAVLESPSAQAAPMMIGGAQLPVLQFEASGRTVLHALLPAQQNALRLVFSAPATAPVWQTEPENDNSFTPLHRILGAATTQQGDVAKW